VVRRLQQERVARFVGFLEDLGHARNQCSSVPLQPSTIGMLGSVYTRACYDTKAFRTEAAVQLFVPWVAVGSGVTDADGEVCFDDLLFGDYTVSETVPAGYHGQADKGVTVDNAATCAAPAAGESVSFVNTPLSDISVSFQPQVSGATAAKISCQGLTAVPPDGTPGAFDDTSETFTDLEPGTYQCTVEIDP
jgi:hypothetical protein